MKDDFLVFSLCLTFPIRNQLGMFAALCFEAGAAADSGGQTQALSSLLRPSFSSHEHKSSQDKSLCSLTRSIRWPSVCLCETLPRENNNIRTINSTTPAQSTLEQSTTAHSRSQPASLLRDSLLSQDEWTLISSQQQISFPLPVTRAFKYISLLNDFSLRFNCIKCYVLKH